MLSKNQYNKFYKNILIPLLLKLGLVFLLLFFPFSTTLYGKTVRIKSNIPIQGQLKYENSSYIIETNIDLQGGVLTIPSSSSLVFKHNGCIKNGSLFFNNTSIYSENKSPLFLNCSFDGHLKKGEYYISQFGVYADGLHEDGKLINDVLRCLDGQGAKLFFDCDGDYGVSKISDRVTIGIGSYTTITFTGKGFIKLLAVSATGAAVDILPGSHDVIINNIQIDGGGLNAIGGTSGQNGIGIGHCKNVTINGGTIRNCLQGYHKYENGELRTGDGGKGVQIENCDVINAVVNDLFIEECSKAISSHRSLTSPGKIEATFNNIRAKNCGQFAIVHQTNGEDLDGSEHIIRINNFTAENCGDEDGVFVFSRTRHLTVTKGKIFGEKKVDAIFRGRIGKSVIENVEINQPCISVICLNPSKYGPDYRKSERNYFDLIVNSEYDYLISSDTKRKYANRSLEKSLVKVRVKDYPQIDLFNHEAIQSGSLTIDIKKDGDSQFNGFAHELENRYSKQKRIIQFDKSDNALTNRRRKNGEVMWDKKNGRLLIWENSKWVEMLK